MSISIIVAMDENNLIGCNNKLPWHIPADLAHFKKITTGKTIVMGRKTYESIGKVLPDRNNIIISSDKNLSIPGAIVVNNIKNIINNNQKQELIIIGGANIYKQTIKYCSRLYITRIKAKFKGDAHFPKLNNNWQIVTTENHKADAKNKYDYSFLVLRLLHSSKE